MQGGRRAFRTRAATIRNRKRPGQPARDETAPILSPVLVVAEPLPAVVERVRALIRPGRRTLLGIAGPPGVGKSTLVETLGDALGEAAAVVGMDGFHLAEAELARLGRRDRKGAPDTFDAHGYAALLARLRADTDPVVYAPRFDRGLEEPIGSAVPVRRGLPLILTEGNYLLLDGDGWSAARACLDHVWYLDLPEDVRVDRLARRHQEFGMGAADALERATRGSDGQNAELVARTRERADLVLHLVPERIES
jgi:pantothenate kinase